MGGHTIIDDLKRAKIVELLDQGKRIDGRGLEEPRQIKIETGVIHRFL